MAITIAEATYTVETIGGPYDDAHFGVCVECGHRTKRMHSERKAKAAIRDHVASHA